MIKKIYISLLLCFVFLSGAKAASVRLSGVVADEQGHPLPFSNVYVQDPNNGTVSKGTTSNADGHYILDLSPGTYQVVFRFLGYKTDIRTVTLLNTAITLNVKLQLESLQLAAVTISGKGKKEDPAYPIIRQAIAKRKYYLEQVDKYTANVYLKGLQRLDKAPKQILGQDVLIPGLDSSGKGILYLSEAVSQYHFQYPNKEKEIIISSRVSGNSKGLTFNSALGLAFNFYKNLVEVEGLSERGFISPVSSNALFTYEYELEGTYEESGYKIHKIKVTPKRREDPAFRGYIYIQDGYWRIHSTDLYLTKDAKIDFVDTFTVAQTYLPIQDSIWMLGTQKLQFSFKLFGFKGDGYYIGIFSEYQLGAEATGKFLKGEIGKIEPEANKKDSTYWEQVRVVPLTEEEIQDYQVKEKLEKKWESKEYKDSLDAISNKFKPSKLILGYTYNDRYRNRTFSFGSLLENVQYNTVEGLVVNLPFVYRKTFNEEKQALSIDNTLRYGFAGKTWYGKSNVTYDFNRIERKSISLEGGKFVSQFNENGPISPFINTVYTLFLEKNYMKLFEKTFLKVNYSQELTNGLYIFPFAEFASRSALINSTNYAFRDQAEKSFTSNDPLNPSQNEASFHNYKAVTVGFNLAIRFRQRFYSRPDFRMLDESKYPRLNIEYRRGIPSVFGSSTNYDFLNLRVRYDLSLGLVGRSSLDASVGSFLSDKVVPFVDYRHFMGNQTLFSRNSLNAFFMLDYYQKSTTATYVEGHYEHHFNGFILNKVPLLRKLKFQEVAGIHILHTHSDTYLEITAGIENILKVGRIDFVTSFDQHAHVGSNIRVRLAL